MKQDNLTNVQLSAIDAAVAKRQTVVTYSNNDVSVFNIVGELGQSSIPSIGSAVDVKIGSAVTSIGDDAFSDCTGLTSVTITNSVTSIGGYAFFQCNSLTSVAIPGSVTSIGEYAFEECNGLASVMIGSGVASIGNAAFSDCTELTSVTITNSVTSIGESAFEGCSGLEKVYVLGKTQAEAEALLVDASLPNGCEIITYATSKYVDDSISAANQSLSNYYLKSETSSAAELSSSLQDKQDISALPADVSSIVLSAAPNWVFSPSSARIAGDDRRFFAEYDDNFDTYRVYAGNYEYDLG